MTGPDYVYLYYSLEPSDDTRRPWEDGSEMTSEQRTTRIDAFRTMKQVSSDGVLFLGVCNIFGGFSTNYVRGSELRIWVIVWVMVMVRVRVWVSVRVRVNVMLLSGKFVVRVRNRVRVTRVWKLLELTLPNTSTVNLDVSTLVVTAVLIPKN